jgi:hypothetical protein
MKIETGFSTTPDRLAYLLSAVREETSADELALDSPSADDVTFVSLLERVRFLDGTQRGSDSSCDKEEALVAMFV